MNRRLSRRDFHKYIGAMTAGTILSACVPKPTSTPSSTYTPTPTATYTYTPTLTPTPIPPRGDGYPKIGWMFANYDLHPTPQQVARYDLVFDGGVIGSGMGDLRMKAVRQLNPRFIGLICNNTIYVGYRDPILTAAGFSEDYLVHFSDSPDMPTPCIVPAYMPNNPCGAPNARVTFPGWAWPNYIWNFANPVAVSFRASYVIQGYSDVKSQHPNLYDGLYFDGTQLGPECYNWYPCCTFNFCSSNGSDACNSQQIVAPEWKNGVLNYLKSIRSAFPDIVIVCNDAINYYDDFPLLSPLINGVVSEGYTSIYIDNYPNGDWQRDVFGPLQWWSQHGVEPRVSLEISFCSPYSPTPISCDKVTQAMLDKGRYDYQRMRFGLATSLMAGAYYQYEFDSYYCAQNRYWYDEYDNAGTQQPGYLGNPVNQSYQLFNKSTGTGANKGVYRRDFQNGIVLCNTNGAKKTVDLGGTFFRIRGTQDPATNNGKPTTQATLNPLDGIVLLNEPTP